MDEGPVRKLYIGIGNIDIVRRDLVRLRAILDRVVVAKAGSMVLKPGVRAFATLLAMMSSFFSFAVFPLSVLKMPVNIPSLMQLSYRCHKRGRTGGITGLRGG